MKNRMTNKLLLFSLLFSLSSVAHARMGEGPVLQPGEISNSLPKEEISASAGNDDTTPAKLGAPQIPRMDAPIPYIPNVSNSYSVGTPEGGLSVNGSGAAEYSLKIDCPNGGSLTPQISLSYNSQSAGYGLAGYGFTVTGISAITRGEKTLFNNNGSIQGVTYTSEDNLFLDGKRLILQSGNACQEGAVYCLEGDPYTKVTAHGTYNNSTADVWFEVKTRSGKTYQYGQTLSSRVSYYNKKGNPRIASWYVSRIEDAYGNYIDYFYLVQKLYAYPTSITYGWNEEKYRHLNNKITFEYTSLGSNARPFNIEDQKGGIDRCLSSVTTSCNDEVYRQYQFVYDESSDRSTGKYTRLVSVEEKNGDGESLTPVQIKWDYLPSRNVYSSKLEVTTKDGSSYVEETDRQFLSADVNGDGFSDIIRVAPVKVTTGVWNGGASYRYGTHVYLSRSKVSPLGTIAYEQPLLYNLPSGISMDILKSMYGGSSIMDFDGDGYNDLIFPFQNTATGYWNQVVFYIIKGSDVAAGRDGQTHCFAVDLQSTDKAPLFVTFDVDGNGKDDVVCVEQCKKDNYYPCTIVQHDEGKKLNQTEVKLTLPQGVNKDIDKIFAGDYNNDGLSDLILLYKGGYKIYYNNGGSEDTPKFIEGNSKTGTGFGDQWRCQQGDFDGDGLMDFVYNVSGETCLWIARNNGDGTFTCTRTDNIGVGDHASNKDDTRFSINVLDIDHDGRSDVMVCKAGYKHRGFPKFKNEYTDTQVRWLYSDGTTLKLVRSNTKKREDDANESSILIGDFDGDGNMELANYGSDLTSTSDSYTENRLNVYKNASDLSQTGKVTCIVDGLGRKTDIEYTHATQPSVYENTHPTYQDLNSKAYPVNTYTFPMSVVKAVTSSNGVAGSQTVKYSYKDFTLHNAGGGPLGFREVSATNTVTGESTTTKINDWDEKKWWLPLETEVTHSIGGKTDITVSSNTIESVNKTYFSYESKKEMKDAEGNTAETYTNFDVEKGVVVDETVKNDGDNMYKKVTYSGYQNKAGVWLPTKLTMTQKHKDDSSPYTSVTTYTYDGKGNILKTVANSGTPQALTTESTYDTYGNCLTSVTKGNGVKPVTRYNEYDATGRFVVKRYESPTSAVNTFTYDIWGNVLTSSDATDPSNVLTTTNTYDGWDRLVSTQDVYGLTTSTKTGWGNSSDKKYYVLQTAAGRPWVLTWYDEAGHEVQQESFGAKNVLISKTTGYNRQGLVSEITSKNGKLILTENLTYDEQGRVIKDELSSGKSTSFSYGNRSVTSTTAGRSYTKTTDAWGNIVSSIDPSGSEVSYVYYSNGSPASITTNGTTVSMTYDEAGYQTSLTDPDAGTQLYEYAADGTLLTQTDGRGVKTTNNYDDLGRLVSTKIGQKTIVYTYGTTGNEKLRLVKQALDDNSVEYTHDKFGRVVAEKRNVNGHGTYSFSYAYNSNNQLSKKAYPGGLEVTYQYDDAGFKSQTMIGNKIIYRLESRDGLVSSSSFMGKLTTTLTRDSRGYESNKRVTFGSTVLENFDESYDGATDNLLSRKRNSGTKESFGYDNLDRLFSVKSGTTETMKMVYAPNGNILSKTGIGSYSYDSSFKPHAVTAVDNSDGTIPSDQLETSFNDFGKIQLIENAGKDLRMDFSYGPNQQRWYSEMSHNGMDVRSTVYAGNYEKVTENGTTREFYYLDGGTIVIRENGVFKSYLAFTDNLGSILSVLDENGTKVFDASYDAWGRQTVTLNTIGLHRGYTGHEMLNDFSIINMNGRLYDPALGRFFSPDDYVQMPDNSQSFNRYSYCLNNPLKYTDPTGDFWSIIVAAAIGGAFNWAAHGFENNAKGLGYFATGAVAGAVSAGIASGVNVAMAGGNFWAGAAGLAKGISSTGFISGAISGASAGFVGGLILGAGDSWVEGNNFRKGLLSGLKSGGAGALMGGIVGGINGGLDALDKGTNFWTGTGKFDVTGAMACKHCDPEGMIDYLKNKVKTIRGKYVTNYCGQNVYESKYLGFYSSGNYSGFTLPDRGIIVGKGVYTNGGINGLAMLQHEFGHVLQYRIVGPVLYYGVIAKESLLNCGVDKVLGTNTHDTFWTETWANYLSKQYFGVNWQGLEYNTKQSFLRYYPSRGCDTRMGIVRCGLSFFASPLNYF